MALATVSTVAVLLSGLASAQSGPGAQPYPSKPIRLVVPFPPGGGYDFVARQIGQRLSEAMGQAVLVDNRAGANGNIGSDVVAKAPPDGYTLLMGGIGPQALSVALYPNLPYKPEKDFAPVSMIGTQPNLLLVNPTLPVKTLAELISYAKAKPGMVTFGSAGNGSGQHFGLEQLKIATAITAIHVPYKGAAPLHMALLAGEVNAAFNIIQLPMQAVRKGDLRALAIASKKRSTLAPEIATMAELGQPIDFDTWYGLYAPADTPREIVAKLNAEVQRALANGDFRERAGALGIALQGGTPEHLAAHMHEEIIRWLRVAKAAGIQPD